ncbi:MAG: selenium-dependent molybdenum cofactor biosynthesis protein YqeB [Anaerolineales bacterium]
MPALILIRGGGDLASGVALRLHRAGLNVAITELPQPLAVRRTVSFANAIYENEITVEDITARLINDPTDTLKILNVLAKQQIPALIDPGCITAKTLNPIAIIDARLMKHPPEALSHRALLYLGLGPGFTAPLNCHAVIETQRGHTLGRVIWDGSTLSDTAKPEGDPRRVLRAPQDGVIVNRKQIGDHCEPEELIAEINGALIKSPFKGVVRGLIHPGLTITRGMKIGDIDPRDDAHLCYLVSEKALAIGGGVMEALLARPEVRSKLWT